MNLQTAQTIHEFSRTHEYSRLIRVFVTSFVDGKSAQRQPCAVILVCFTERAENVIRIFSARLATPTERGEYEEYTF